MAPGAVGPATAGAVRQSPAVAGEAGLPGPVLEPGQAACPDCGGGNDPRGRWCHHCGASQGTAVEDPVAWRPAAGFRAHEEERGRALRRLAVVLVVLAVPAGAMIVGANVLQSDQRGGSAATGTAGAGPAPAFAQVSGVDVEASSESGARRAALLVDGRTSTFWSRLPGDRFAKLSFSFAEPVRLGRIAIAAGAAGAEFERRHRPRTVELAFSDGTTLTRNLADRPRFQHLDFPPRSVARVTITIADVFQAPRTAENYNRTSLSEVRFYRPA